MNRVSALLPYTVFIKCKPLISNLIMSSDHLAVLLEIIVLTTLLEPSSVHLAVCLEVK